MACSNGSQKKQNAPDFINLNNIGVLCFLFGLEGELCRLLDLIPDAIKKIVALDPNKGNGDEIFKDILTKVGKTSFGLVIDELTNQIDVSQFCGTEPPEPLEQINFSDVFIFIAELVPILEKFFTVNEVLSGDSTKILEKIVNVWVRSQWFENCECIPDPVNPPPDPNDPPTIPPPHTDLPDCPSPTNDPIGNPGKKRTRNVWLTNIDPATGNRSFNCTDVNACGGSLIRSRYGFEKISLGNGLKVWIAKEFESLDPNIFSVYVCNPTTLFCYLSFETLLDGNWGMWWKQGNNPWKPFGGDPSFMDGLPFEPCERIDTTDEVTDDFCGLYPDDPLCLPPFEQDCEVANFVVPMHVNCETRIRKPVRRVLRTNGIYEEITVNEFVSCGERTSKKVKLLVCGEIIEGCTNPDSINYDPLANTDNGSCVSSCELLRDEAIAYTNNLAATGRVYLGDSDPDGLGDFSRYYQIGDIEQAQGIFRGSELYSRVTECQADLEIWFEEAWNAYFTVQISGCTDSGALNYNPDATIDDGSCEY